MRNNYENTTMNHSKGRSDGNVHIFALNTERATRTAWDVCNKSQWRGRRDGRNCISTQLQPWTLMGGVHNKLATAQYRVKPDGKERACQCNKRGNSTTFSFLIADYIVTTTSLYTIATEPNFANISLYSSA